MNILAVTLSNIGDVVLTTPVFCALRSRYPSAHITGVAGPKAASLLSGSRIVNEVVVYNKRASLKEKLLFILSLRKRRYDLTVDLRNTAIPFLVRTRTRSPLFRTYKAASMRERHMEVLRMTGIDAAPDGPFDFFTPEDQKSAFEKLRQTGAASSSWIAVSAGAASEAKRWPLANYRAVIEKLLQMTSEPVVLIGDGSERDYVEPLCRINPGRIFNMAGKTNLKEFAALISQSALLLTNDSAAMHLGHELKKNVVAFFGPTDPEKYGRSGGCFKLLAGQKSPDAEGDPFRGVTPEKALEACCELLQPLRSESCP